MTDPKDETKPCYCGAGCALSLDEVYGHGPCEGPVEVEDEIDFDDDGFVWVHLCRKHAKGYWNED